MTHKEIEFPQNARQRQEAHAGRRARQAVGTGKRTAARCLIIEDAFLERRHLLLAISKRHAGKIGHRHSSALLYAAILAPHGHARQQTLAADLADAGLIKIHGAQALDELSLIHI